MEIILKRKGMTKKELAKKLGISQPTLSKKFKYNDWRESDIQEISQAIGAKCDIVFKLDDGTEI